MWAKISSVCLLVLYFYSQLLWRFILNRHIFEAPLNTFLLEAMVNCHFVTRGGDSQPEIFGSLGCYFHSF
ncbi:hypothetical protein Gasu2_39460 [Galdieria sulphuraria]|nr:hypothetical protein Gasu2_39460 [Galdieria sulphuraria]